MLESCVVHLDPLKMDISLPSLIFSIQRFYHQFGWFYLFSALANWRALTRVLVDLDIQS